MIKEVLMTILGNKIDQTLEELLKEGKVHFNKKTGEFTITIQPVLVEDTDTTFN